MSFKDIRGQERAIEHLTRALAGGTFAHAYLFAGPSGIGKRAVALTFAKALNCARATNDSCDECPSCRKIDRAGAADLVFIEPEAKGSGEIKIDMVRDLRHLLNLKAYELRKKVCIIDGADRMTPEAANALLKVLEEPPPDTVLILIAEATANVLPTILSRCRLVRFSAVGDDVLEEILAGEHGLDRPKARSLAQFSAGRIGQALRFKDSGLIDEKNRVIDGALDGTLFGDDRAVPSKDEVGWMLDVLLSWYRDIALAKLGLDPSLYINVDRRDLIAREAARRSVGIDEVVRLSKEIIRCRSCLGSNVNPKLARGVLGEKVRTAGAGPGREASCTK